MEAKFNLWLEKNGRVALSRWRVQLLEAIAATGSISGAARALNVPYRRAWEKVHEIETALGFRVLTTATGGEGGGGAALTPEAENAIRQFHTLSAGLEDEIQRRQQRIFS